MFFFHCVTNILNFFPKQYLHSLSKMFDFKTKVESKLGESSSTVMTVVKDSFSKFCINFKDHCEDLNLNVF